MSATLQSKPKLPVFLSLILVTVLGVSLAKLMWLIITPERKVSLHEQELGEIEGTQRTKVDYGKLISKQHLFGEVKKKVVVKKAPPKVEKKAVITKTKLNLTLHGIVAYKSKKGFALISSNGGSQKVFGEGDELQKGVKVSEIYPEKVIIDNNGSSEELVLPKRQIKSKSKAKSAKRNSAPKRSFGSKKKKSTTAGSVAKKSKNNSPDIAGFRTAAMANPNKLLEIARASPAIIDNQFVGFRLQPGRKRKFFRQLGFRPNDIVTEVNGIIIDSPSKGAMVLGELSQAADLSITVKRGNQEIHIQHSF